MSFWGKTTVNLEFINLLFTDYDNIIFNQEFLYLSIIPFSNSNNDSSNIEIDEKFLAMKKYFSTNKLSLNPWFITGFCDAESSFQIHVNKRSANKLGWRVYGRFDISLHKKDLPLLLLIQSYFNGIGSIVIDEKRNKVSFCLSNLNDFNKIIIPFFDKYQLQSAKKIFSLEKMYWING